MVPALLQQWPDQQLSRTATAAIPHLTPPERLAVEAVLHPTQARHAATAAQAPQLHLGVPPATAATAAVQTMMHLLVLVQLGQQAKHLRPASAAPMVQRLGSFRARAGQGLPTAHRHLDRTAPQHCLVLPARQQAVHFTQMRACVTAATTVPCLVLTLLLVQSQQLAQHLALRKTAAVAARAPAALAATAMHRQGP